MMHEPFNPFSQEPHNFNFLVFFFAVVAMILLMVFAFRDIVRAEEFSNDQIANAIYKAENSKKHPYGIMQHYKHTTPRQACINTIVHAKKDWNGRGDFISFLGSRYCPVSAHPLNKFWIKNVKYFLTKEAT